ncbi:amino acid-binding protein [Haloferax profundi]|uniref:Amino acid-binding protein n=2 Tax=Haloferax profundi TaxID=1544718 RepID=A0A0W1SLN6_9EURY|nr:amino acid-binding protein [Haloferax profundi]
MTGPYGGLAVGQRNGAELAIKHVNENDDLDVEITGVYEDTEADPSTGRRKAQSVVEQDGASYIMGAISSSVALALNEFAADNEVIYNPGGAAVPITGSNCNEWVFRAETNTAQMAEAVSDFTAENLGTNVWFHIADYAYGESVMSRVEKRMKDGHDINVVGRSRSQLGSTNFNSYISQIANSDADVAVLGMTGGDLINFVKQAASQGLKQDVNLMSPTMTFSVVRGALGEAAYGTYGGVRYLPSLETGDNQTFVEAYRSEYDADPDNFARAAYMSIRMTARGIAEADSTDPAEVKDVLPGLEMDSILGPNQFRDCDHQAMNPVWPGELVAPESGSGPAAVELGEMIDGADALPPCADLGCNL